MRLAPLALALAALGFVGFGLAFLVAPDLLALVDLAPTTSAARSDVRAIYGGMELGVGVLLALAARRPAWWRLGLTAQALTLGGAAVGRLVGVALDGTPRALTGGFAALEVVGTVLAVVALRQLGPAPASSAR